MAKSIDIFKLPAGPAEICFDKNEFMKKTFTVDEFLHNHRNAATLETIRDDLGIYLKVLRSAMIELINEDYADFVNLSSDLVGLDQSIGKIQLPLQALREEIASVRTVVGDTMLEIADSLEMKRLLHEQLKNVRSFIAARQSSVKLRKLLDEELRSDADETVNPIMLERAAMELVRLKHDLAECQPLIDRTKTADELNQYDAIRDRLLRKIEVNFLKVLSAKNVEHLERCLQVYCTLGEYRTAEDIFRREIVAPYMHDVISETALQNSPHGLNGVYKQILQFVDDRMKQLLSLTQPNVATNAGIATVSGFDFMLNSFWIEVERRLETHMASIFAPGNPDLFYQKYKCTNEFLIKIEEIIRNEKQVERLHAHTQYKQFQTKWNLPVYFQIRFQEIGGALETACSASLTDNALYNPTSSTKYNLKPFSIAYECLEKCWTDGIYLPQIFNRFLKLSLQIYSRLASWIDAAILADNWPKVTVPNQRSRVDFLVVLYIDINQTINESNNISAEIVDKMPVHLRAEHDIVEQCIKESRQIFAKRLTQIEEQWNKEMLRQTAAWTKQVADIPRLYRKTNREAPTKPCNYVDQILKPAKSFIEAYSTKIAPDTVQRCLVYVFSQLNKQYYTAVTDVLNSVKKTEESLRRLKNLREKSSNNNPNQSSSGGGSGMSDDDKIRLQLHVDISAWMNAMEQMHVDRNCVEKLNELKELIQNNTNERT